MTAWNGTAIITTESESCRQRHRNEKKKGETVSSSGLETERWLGALLPLGAKTNESGPDLQPDQDDLGPREKEVMSVALVMTDRVCSFLTSGEASLGGGTPPTSLSQASHLAILRRNESEILGDRKFITNLERICRGCSEKAVIDWELVPESSCQEITRFHVTNPAIQ